MVFLIMPERHRLVSVKVAGDDLSGTLDFLSERWKEYRPGYPFTYMVLESEVEGLYAGERRLGRVLVYFAVLALLVGCLGLSGLASYIAEERTREIGIRKVTGATVEQIVALLSKDFARVGYRAVRAAVADPARSLRYE